MRTQIKIRGVGDSITYAGARQIGTSENAPAAIDPKIYLVAVSVDNMNRKKGEGIAMTVLGTTAPAWLVHEADKVAVSVSPVPLSASPVQVSPKSWGGPDTVVAEGA